MRIAYFAQYLSISVSQYAPVRNLPCAALLPVPIYDLTFSCPVLISSTCLHTNVRPPSFVCSPTSYGVSTPTNVRFFKFLLIQLPSPPPLFQYEIRCKDLYRLIFGDAGSRDPQGCSHIQFASRGKVMQYALSLGPSLFFITDPIAHRASQMPAMPVRNGQVLA